MDNRITIPEFKAEIDGDKAYPIFRFEAWVKYDGVEHDYFSSNIIYKEYPTYEKNLHHMEEWWNTVINKKPLYGDKIPMIQKHLQIERLQFRLVEYETWSIRWFSHCTFVDNRTDKELMESFHRFITRKLPLHNKEEYCLMGAEESWRIKKPCHCKDCEAQGMTIIMH